MIVPNEWLVDLLMGTPADQQAVHAFLDDIDASGERLAIRRRSPLGGKIVSSPKDRFARAKRLVLMLHDSEKVRLVEEEEIQALPPELAEKVPRKDVYLVETALAVPPCVLVTTDRKLRDSLLAHTSAQFRVELFEDFHIGG